MQKTSIESGINFSVILSMTALTTFLTALAFYILYKEGLKKKHYLGMMFLVFSVFLVSSSERSEGPHTGHTSTDQRASVIWPILFTFLACCTFTVFSITAREASFSRMSSLQFTADSIFPISIIFVCMIIYEHT